MSADVAKTGGLEWATTGGDAWADRWRDTDAGLSGLSPHLLSALLAGAPRSSFRAFDIGCGAGSTSIALAAARPDAAITACDISPALVDVARQRTAALRQIGVLQGDAEAVAEKDGPFDLIFSRHGVMFFPDPVRALRAFRSAAKSGAVLVFSCFRSWALNAWASELADAAAGRVLPSPGREPSGFAFADAAYVLQILSSSGWAQAEPLAVDFRYVAGEGGAAVEQALSFVSDIGPAARRLQSLPEEDRPGALERMRGVIERHFDGRAVAFPAAAWIWTAKAVSAVS